MARSGLCTQRTQRTQRQMHPSSPLRDVPWDADWTALAAGAPEEAMVRTQLAVRSPVPWWLRARGHECTRCGLRLPCVGVFVVVTGPTWKHEGWAGYVQRVQICLQIQNTGSGKNSPTQSWNNGLQHPQRVHRATTACSQVPASRIPVLAHSFVSLSPTSRPGMAKQSL